jgi:fructose-bisphosphate aldolase class I
VLARYAAICQEHGIVPIVEPEVLIDGDHTLERSREVSDDVLHAVFHALHRHRVQLEYMVLKPSMVLPGKERSPKAAPEVVARETLGVLRRNVPAAVPTINFLSGGQSAVDATANLNAMNRLGGAPWVLSFSYARALQDDAMKTWGGRAENKREAQQAFHRRARMNSLARAGKWTPDVEKAA